MLLLLALTLPAAQTPVLLLLLQTGCCRCCCWCRRGNGRAGHCNLRVQQLLLAT
jgi:hypothetical protein